MDADATAETVPIARVTPIESVVTQLEAAMPSTERKRIADLSHELDAVTAPFAQRRIERDLSRALSGRDADTVGTELGMRQPGA